MAVIFSIITSVLIIMEVVLTSNGQRFKLSSSSQSPRLPRLQVDGANGKVYASVGRQLYRLNMNLEQEEARSLTSESLNSSLSTDGRWLVVCLNDPSCEVYNTSSFSAGPVFRRENIISSPLNMSLFAAEDSFYVGSFIMGQTDQMVLSQYIFTGTQTGSSQSGMYSISASAFQRSFFGGFVKGNFSYFFGIDSSPSNIRSIRVLRVCHNSNFRALYELSLVCGGRPGSPTRVSGVIAVDNFAGISGTTVVLSSSRPGSTRNYVCIYSLETIDQFMLNQYSTCTASSTERYLLAWRSAEDSCGVISVSRLSKVISTQLELLILFLSLLQQSSKVCNFMTTSNVPLALDEADDIIHGVAGTPVVFLGVEGQDNFITAMTAALVETFSFAFVAFTDPNGDSFITGVSN